MRSSTPQPILGARDGEFLSCVGGRASANDEGAGARLVIFVLIVRSFGLAGVLIWMREIPKCEPQNVEIALAAIGEMDLHPDEGLRAVPRFFDHLI